jgi:hypothetical protein
MEENSTNSPFYKEKTYWAFITNQKSQTVWMAFKWFGKHEVSIYSPDFNMLRWYMNTVFSQEHNDLANSVKSNNNNVIGVFGSASVVRKEIFLLKNQP